MKTLKTKNPHQEQKRPLRAYNWGRDTEFLATKVTAFGALGERQEAKVDSALFCKFLAML